MSHDASSPTALVLEGGAMRGLFSAGVMDVMLEHALRFDVVVGVSAGAAFGCNYKSRQPGRVLRYNIAMAHNWRFCSMRSLLLTGDLIGACFAYHTLPERIDRFDFDTYRSDPTRFFAVCTDVDTGAPLYKELPDADYKALEYIRASASMPLFSRIVRLDGHRLLDGGVADSIPLEFVNRMGCRRAVVVLTQPAGFVKQPTPAMPLMRLGLWRHPRFLKALAERHIMYNRQLEYVAAQEAAGDAVVVRPPYPLPVGHITHDPALMQRIYNIGREAGLATLPAIRKMV